MEYLHNGFTLDTPKGTFPLSTDSILLADFVRLPKNASVLDLGSGCGTLGLLLCAKDPGCSVTGMEIDPLSHEAATQNIRRNGLESRMESICGDLRSAKPGTYHCCVSNPPYFSGGPASKDTPLARRNDCCDAEDLFRCAAQSLRFGGDFFLVHKPDRLAQLCACGAKYGLEAKHLCLVRHRPGQNISLILLQLRKGAKPGLTIREQCLYNADGSPTEYYKKLYHLQEV